MKVPGAEGVFDDALVPSMPKAGDALIACEHRPRPGAAHYFYLPKGMDMLLDGGSERKAHWILLCDGCRAKHPRASSAPLQYAAVWGENGFGDDVAEPPRIEAKKLS